MNVKSTFDTLFDEPLFQEIRDLCLQPTHSIKEPLQHDVLYCLMKGCILKLETIETDNDRENKDEKTATTLLKDSLNIVQLLRNKDESKITKVVIKVDNGPNIEINSSFFKHGVVVGLKDHLIDYLRPEDLTNKKFVETMSDPKTFDKVTRSHLVENTGIKNRGGYTYQNFLYFFTNVLWNFLTRESLLDTVNSGKGDLLQKDFIIELYKIIDLQVYSKYDSADNENINKQILISIRKKDQKSTRDMVTKWLQRGQAFIQTEEENYKDYFFDKGLEIP